MSEASSDTDVSPRGISVGARSEWSKAQVPSTQRNNSLEELTASVLERLIIANPRTEQDRNGPSIFRAWKMDWWWMSRLCMSM